MHSPSEPNAHRRVDSPKVMLPGDWLTVNGLIRREQMLMPSADLRSRLAASLEALPQPIRREFPGTSDHWVLLGTLLLPTVLLYALLYGFLAWIWNHPLELAYRYSGWIPSMGSQAVQWLASVQSNRRSGLLESLQNQISPWAWQAEWQSVLLFCGLSLVAAELAAILLLHRLKTYNL